MRGRYVPSLWHVTPQSRSCNVHPATTKTRKANTKTQKPGKRFKVCEARQLNFGLSTHHRNPHTKRALLEEPRSVYWPQFEIERKIVLSLWVLSREVKVLSRDLTKFPKFVPE